MAGRRGADVKDAEKTRFLGKIPILIVAAAPSGGAGRGRRPETRRVRATPPRRADRHMFG